MAKKYKPGDRVVIREWDNMEEQFGLKPSGSINCQFTFTTEMAQYCGREFTIKEADSEGRVWFLNQPHFSFSNDMVIPAGSIDPMEVAIPDVDIDEFLRVMEG